MTVAATTTRTPRTRTRMRLVATGSALAVGLALAGGVPTGTVPATAAPPAARTAQPAPVSYDATSSKERQRVDRVKTPTLRWSTCRGTFTCASVRLPLDYDHPKGDQVEVALLRHAAPTKDKVGTLFLNPGGPGDSGTEYATYAEQLLPASILDHFDVVGFDPRGVGSSTDVRCFRDADAQERATAPIADISFPDSAATAKAYLKVDRAVAKACSSRGKPLATSMSTAQVARDLDVLRRAVGDDRLTYLGFSYGTYIGQVYANLFPDRVRAVALDGVIDPVAWQGSSKTRNDPAWDRIRSAESTKGALDTLLDRCAAAGPSRCTFAGETDPRTGFIELTRRLRADPLLLDDGAGGTIEYGYDDLVGEVLDDLYATEGARDVDALLTDLWTLSDPNAPAERRTSAMRAVVRAQTGLASRRDGLVRRSADDYDTSLDAFVAVNCTDSVRLDKATDIQKAADKADHRVPYFGALWAWNTLGCAKDSFRATDEDAYRGSFQHRTLAPLLFVGDTYDPVTSLAAATRAADLAPNSALVSSTSWGHTAYNTSACVSDAVDAYLVSGRAPSAKVTSCVGDYQPFAASSAPTLSRAPASERLVAAGRAAKS